MSPYVVLGALRRPKHEVILHLRVATAASQDLWQSLRELSAGFCCVYLVATIHNVV